MIQLFVIAVCSQENQELLQQVPNTVAQLSLSVEHVPSEDHSMVGVSQAVLDQLGLFVGDAVELRTKRGSRRTVATVYLSDGAGDRVLMSPSIRSNLR